MIVARRLAFTTGGGWTKLIGAPLYRSDGRAHDVTLKWPQR